jgi:hypothetical protein
MGLIVLEILPQMCTQIGGKTIEKSTHVIAEMNWFSTFSIVFS